MNYTLLQVVVVGLAVFVAIAVVVALRRKSSGDVLRVIGVNSLHDVLLPDSVGGQIHLEHVLLTAKGIVVVDVKSFDGTIFASNRSEEWTVISGLQRFTFPNPQVALFDRVAAIKAISRDIPVNGVILFSGNSEFAKDRPSDTIFPSEMLEQFRKPDVAELERIVEAFAPHWEKVVSASESAFQATERV